MIHKNLLTKDGYNNLTEQLKEFKKKQEHLIIEIEEVAQPDESGEDGLATQLKEELELINEKIDDIEVALEDAKIVDNACEKHLQVEIGCKVKVKIANKIIKEFTIVSHLEADPHVDKISNESPLGVALLGKKVNDQVEVDAPAGKIIYKIISIS
ncbi:MAG: GreA/GreB family elongation factor [Candidatus Shapirobacteria bacterium]